MSRPSTCPENRDRYKTSNLFVSFFTTTSRDSGIGLALSQQIVQSHAAPCCWRIARTGGAHGSVSSSPWVRWNDARWVVRVHGISQLPAPIPLDRTA